MVRRRSGKDNPFSRETPPATAHRLAAWLSVATSFMDRKPIEIRFPPHPDDVAALEALWHQRLVELRDAGLPQLQKHLDFKRATACKPHAFAYMGEGRPCRFAFCPWCNAASAAEAYERARRVKEDRKGNVSFILTRLHTGFSVDDQGCRCGDIHFPEQGLGHLFKRYVWPDTYSYRLVINSCRVLLAEERMDMEAFKMRTKKNDERGRRVGKTHWQVDGNRVVPTIGCTTASVYCTPDFLVPETRYGLAVAVSKVFKHPPALWFAPPAIVVRALGICQHNRSSGVVGAFRKARVLLPERYPLEWVKTRSEGPGVAAKAVSCLNDPHQYQEAVAVREFCRLLGIPVVDSCKDLYRHIRVPFYWLGMVNGDSLVPFLDPQQKSDFAKAVLKARPARDVLPEKHGLFGLLQGSGLFVLSTWPDLQPYTDNEFAHFNHMILKGKRVGGICYTGESGHSYALRLAHACRSSKALTA